MLSKLITTLDEISPDRIKTGQELEFFKMIDAALEVGVAVLDENMIYRYMGQGMMEQLGLPEGTLKVGDSLEDCHRAMVKHGIIQEKVLKDERIDPESNKSGEVELDNNFIHTFSNGRKIQLLRKKLPNGYLVSMSYDVSSLVDKDEILEESLRLGNAGYWTYDFHTKKYDLSKTLQAYFGPHGVEKINQEGIIHIVHKDDRAKFKHALANLSSNNDMFDVTARTNTGKGNERYSRSTGKIHRDKNGKPLSIRSFVKDVTKEHFQSMALERAKDEAIAASHAKSEFLANMSHEIRTPMNGVLGMAELLANTDINDRQREFVNVINDSASALLTIINDILDFSKIEAGALELDPTAFDLRDIINDVTSLLKSKSMDKELELIVNYPTVLPRRFIGDAGRLRQVVTNLVSNAVKFTDRGHVLIDVSVAAPSRSSNKSMISVNVTDTGIGIEPDKIEHIFQKFTQADGSTTRNYGGTGLGLSISKKIIELMNGRMSAKSTFGKGSTFGFIVPLAQDSSQDLPEYDLTIAAGKRVLIVDDIEVNRNLLAQQVQSWEMSPITCDNGVDALLALRTATDAGTPFDLILMDYLMPGMNGAELASMISANPSLGHPPVIMLSSCDQPSSSEELAQIGILSFLMKPARETQLFKTITNVLSAPTASLPTLPKLKPTADIKGMIAPPPAAPPNKVDVLVAEDFKLNQDVVRLMLADTDFAPTFANNGAEAVDLFKSEPDRYKLILMDVSMPVMDGYEATNQINSFNEDSGRQHTPIIALTGHALKYDRDNCLDAGMDEYLVKPVQQTKLIAMLNKFIEGTKQNSAAA